MPSGAVTATKVVGPKGETRTVSDTVARQVWVAAGGRCTVCNRYLSADNVTGQEVSIGQLAHIVGWSTAPGSPRGDHELPVEQRNSAENLMLLCHDQHRVIDHKSLWEVLDVDTLRAMKRSHEERIRKLTGLGHENRTTVLRVVGNIHGRPVELNSSSVTTALLANNRFPDWILRGADEFEVDLRAIPGEPISSPAYWTAVRSHLEDRLTHLCTQVRKEAVNHVSVFRLRVLGLALSSLLLTTSATASADAQVSPRWSCGFYFTNPDHEFGVNARYYHCGNSFILIRVDWNTGWHYLDCVPPWYSVAFRPDGRRRVVNAYYVPIAPALMGEGDHQMCRTAQPQG